MAATRCHQNMRTPCAQVKNQTPVASCRHGSLLGNHHPKATVTMKPFQASPDAEKRRCTLYCPTPSMGLQALPNTNIFPALPILYNYPKYHTPLAAGSGRLPSPGSRANSGITQPARFLCGRNDHPPRSSGPVKSSTSTQTLADRSQIGYTWTIDLLSPGNPRSPRWPTT